MKRVRSSSEIVAMFLRIPSPNAIVIYLRVCYWFNSRYGDCFAAMKRRADGGSKRLEVEPLGRGVQREPGKLFRLMNLVPHERSWGGFSRRQLLPYVCCLCFLLVRM